MYGGCSELQPCETEGKSSITKGRYLISYMYSELSTNCNTVDDKKLTCHLGCAKTSYCSQASASRCVSVFTTMLGWYLLSFLQDNLQNLKSVPMLKTCWRKQMLKSREGKCILPQRREHRAVQKECLGSITEYLHHTVLCLSKTHCFVCKVVSATCWQKAGIIMKNSKSETSDPSNLILPVVKHS